jgi:HTH-type transcriptional regulator/antitoxin HipB
MMRGRVTSAEALGRMVQQGRQQREMTQRELAEHLGISQRYVWEIESGKPTKYTERLFETLRVTGVQLWAEIPEPTDE